MRANKKLFLVPHPRHARASDRGRIVARLFTLHWAYSRIEMPRAFLRFGADLIADFLETLHSVVVNVLMPIWDNTNPQRTIGWAMPMSV